MDTFKVLVVENLENTESKSSETFSSNYLLFEVIYLLLITQIIWRAIASKEHSC